MELEPAVEMDFPVMVQLEEVQMAEIEDCRDCQMDPY